MTSSPSRSRPPSAGSKPPPSRPPPPIRRNSSAAATGEGESGDVTVISRPIDMASSDIFTNSGGFSSNSDVDSAQTNKFTSGWDSLFGTGNAPTSNFAVSDGGGFDDKFEAFGLNGHAADAIDSTSGFLGFGAGDRASTAGSQWSDSGNTDPFATGSFTVAAAGGSPASSCSRARPRPTTQPAPTGGSANPFSISLQAATANRPDYGPDEDEDDAVFGATSTTNNPFADNESDDVTILGVDVSSEMVAAAAFNPFATIADEENGGDNETEVFDPFQTIHDDDALNVPFSSTERDIEDDVTSPTRFNPFDKETPPPGRFISLEPKKSEDILSPKSKSLASSFDDEPELENLEPLEPFLPRWEAMTGGWNLLLRQPFRKQLTQNRFWKPAFVRVGRSGPVGPDGLGTPTIRIFNDDKSSECLHELVLEPSYSLCEMGLQQMDQFGKCHTVKIQQVVYKESVGMKSDRIAPTIGDLARVRDLKGLKDLIHKPKATMLLDHAPHATEILKFGGLEYAEFKNFVYTMEDLFFSLKLNRAGKSATYTKDEVTVDVQDEYYADIDRDGHITRHKARVRLFCLAFLSGTSPVLEVGVNDRRRKGHEVVGRRDIIPIKTEEWIRIEDSEQQQMIDAAEFERSKVLRFVPLDACRFELMRFRVRPRPNVELPLQVRVQMSVDNRHIEIRAEVVVTGYYSSSRRAAQTPCEDIQIRFPLPEPWIYLFRVERRFKYGSVHSATRKPGKIKGLERLTQLAQGILPPSLIEVSAGLAKYEHAFKAIVWRIDQLPERNEGAYKTHLFALNVDLGPQDPMPESLDKFVKVEYSMSNSTVSRAQIRSISVSGTTAEDPPDRWVRHMARYEYTVEIEFTDRVRCKPELEDIADAASNLSGNLRSYGTGEASASPGGTPEHRPRNSGDESSSTDDSD